MVERKDTLLGRFRRDTTGTTECTPSAHQTQTTTYMRVVPANLVRNRCLRSSYPVRSAE
jgi:hypothetical protein